MFIKLLKPEDFIWKPLYVNNIIANGLEGYYCLIDTGDGGARKFTVLFQWKADITGMVRRDDEPELLVLFEQIYGRIIGPIEIPEPVQKGYYYNCISDYNGKNTFGHDSVHDYGNFIRVFKTLHDAFCRAYVQYAHIYGYLLDKGDMLVDKEAATRRSLYNKYLGEDKSWVNEVFYEIEHEEHGIKQKAIISASGVTVTRIVK